MLAIVSGARRALQLLHRTLRLCQKMKLGPPSELQVGDSQSPNSFIVYTIYIL